MEALSSIYGDEWCVIDESSRVFCIKVSDDIYEPKSSACLQVKESQSSQVDRSAIHTVSSQSAVLNTTPGTTSQNTVKLHCKHVWYFGVFITENRQASSQDELPFLVHYCVK